MLFYHWAKEAKNTERSTMQNAAIIARISACCTNIHIQTTATVSLSSAMAFLFQATPGPQFEQSSQTSSSVRGSAAGRTNPYNTRNPRSSISYGALRDKRTLVRPFQDPLQRNPSDKYNQPSDEFLRQGPLKEPRTAL